MNKDYIYIGIAAVFIVGVYYYYDNQRTRMLIAYQQALMTPAGQKSQLNQAGINALEQVGGGLVNSFLNFLNPNSSGVRGVTETNYTTSVATS